MLLRKITQHIHDQDWFAIVVDLVIVVVGVFIGIQVANWNDDRKASANEAALIVRLSEEIKVLEAELAIDAEGYKLIVEATGDLLTFLRAGTPPADEQLFRRALWQANHFYEIPSLSASYEELVASGGLSRISDVELRAALISYGDHFDRYDRLYSVAFGTIIDSNSNYLEAVQWSADPNLWGNPETAIVSYDWDELQNAKTELQAWLAVQDDAGRNVRNMHLDVKKIRALLGQ